MRPIEPVVYQGDIPNERGPVPELRWIPIADLRVDDAYQRPITAQGERNIRAIVKAFDWRMFAPVVVCPVEGGVYAIVDGQHRTTAAVVCGIDSVPCLVIQADRQMQARSFHAINGTVTQIDATAIYKAKLAAGDPDALRIAKIGEDANVRVLTYRPSWTLIRPRETIALLTLQRSLATHEDWLVAVVLAAVAESAGDRGGLLSALTIGAFMNVFADHKEWLAREDLPDLCASFSLVMALQDIAIEAALKRMPKGPLLEAALVTHLSNAIDRRSGHAS